jgi:xylan 1,4-beta-xylosidase
VSPPRDLTQWSVLIEKIVTQWVQRYGLDEVRTWFFEVWNEPNLTAFGSGKQEDYFPLYGYTVEAIKNIDDQLKIDGPATADNAWVEDFLAFRKKHSLPVDFSSTHHQPNGVHFCVGTLKPGDDTEAQLAVSKRSALRGESAAVRRQAGDLPVYCTAWCTSSNTRDPMRDDPYAAAFIMTTVLEQNGLVQGYSFFTFSNIFEENDFPLVPFAARFRADEHPGHRQAVLSHLCKAARAGPRVEALDGEQATVDAWLVRDGNSATVIPNSFAVPRM